MEVDISVSLIMKEGLLLIPREQQLSKGSPSKGNPM